MVALPWSLLIAAVGSTSGESASAPVVHTQFGALLGARLPSGVQQFMGIPYAVPPTGQRRFANPVPWSEPYQHPARPALEAGPQCPQPGSQGSPTSEACLFLNVWMPRTNTNRSFSLSRGLPVMVWIHGGSFLTGNGDQYNATTIVKKHGAIVVTINYRLGHLGWMQVVKRQGNFGLRDQQVALRWVAANIASFGGDPSRITAFGESAGGISLHLHLVAPGSAGLFHAVLSESGFPTAIPQATALELADKYASYAGCAGGSAASILTCLRAASLANLTKAGDLAVPTDGKDPFTNPAWGATVDGVEIMDDPLKLVEQRRFSNPNVSLLAGTNTNEGSVFVYPFQQVKLGAVGFKSLIHACLVNDGNNVSTDALDEVFVKYPPDTTQGSDNRKLASDLLGDLSFICGTRFVAQQLSSTAGGGAVYVYRFNHHAASDPTPAAWGITHGSEVPFVFDHGDWIWTNSAFTAPEQQLATIIGTTWASFATSGSPGNATPTLPWPAYTNASDMDLVFDTGTGLHVEKHPRATYCDFWAAWRLRHIK